MLAASEAIIVLSRPDQLNCAFRQAERVVIEWLDERNIALRESERPREVLALAVAVAEKHGLGRRALSNLDCFHYAYAKAADAPILTLDRPLRETDVAALRRPTAESEPPSRNTRRLSSRERDLAKARLTA
jgi:ribonuclease VapC